MLPPKELTVNAAMSPDRDQTIRLAPAFQTDRHLDNLGQQNICVDFFNGIEL